jgi:RND family efflux transporter MFP subunit
MIARFLLPMLILAGPAVAKDYACLIEPEQLLKLAAPVQGVVDSVTVSRGDRVRKGQLVAELASDVEQADVAIARLRAVNDTAIAAAQAKLDFAKAEFSRRERLLNNSFGGAAELDKARSEEKEATAKLREAVIDLNLEKLQAQRAEALLSQRRISSPVDGIVTERTLGPGEFLNDQQHILTIAQMDPLKVETFLPTSVYGQIKVGQSAEVMPEAPVSGVYPAKVVVVDQVFDAASNTVGVRLELPNPDFRLPAGIHCRVRFNGLP